MDHLIQLLTQNQFMSGGLILMLSGGLMAALRNSPRQLWKFVKRRSTFSVEILNSDPFFHYVTFWLDKQDYTKRSRRLSVATKTSVDSDEEEDAKQRLTLIYSPAPGNHIFFYKRNLLWLHREKKELTSGGGNGGDSLEKTLFSAVNPETYTITILGKKQQVIRELLEEILAFGSKPKESIKFYTSRYAYWKAGVELNPRRLDSVVLPQGVGEGVLADARKFINSKDWYKKVGIPWHRGYLFHGIPGSGKTSLVAALAGELKVDLYVMNVGNLSDEQFNGLMGEIRPGSMIVMEDVDCTFPTREKATEKNGLSLACLLNSLDGIQSCDGCMVFMTTNFLDKLDETLLRPGRVDMEVEFGPADDEQIIRLKERIAPGIGDARAIFECHGRSMAEVQNWLVKNKENACLNVFAA